MGRAPRALWHPSARSVRPRSCPLRAPMTATRFRLAISCRLLSAVESCLSTPAADFRRSVAGVVTALEKRRRSCPPGAVKALFSRVLFMMARCNRLLVTEPAHGGGGGRGGGGRTRPAGASAAASAACGGISSAVGREGLLAADEALARRRSTSMLTGEQGRDRVAIGSAGKAPGACLTLRRACCLQRAADQLQTAPNAPEASSHALLLAPSPSCSARAPRSGCSAWPAASRRPARAAAQPAHQHAATRDSGSDGGCAEAQ